MSVLAFIVGLLVGYLVHKEFNIRRKLRHMDVTIHAGGNLNMASAPINITLFSDQSIPVTVAPLLANGDPDNAVDVSWSSSSDSVQVVERADGRTADILTPADAGAAVITAKAPGYEDQAFNVSYTPRAARSLNASVGEPTSDL